MIAPNFKAPCMQAESYYYDFLYKDTILLIPETIVNHINQCAVCQEKINQLRAALLESKKHLELGQREISSAIIEILKLHFAYIGKLITCEIVQPFLPTLLDEALGIRIPTPITTHLDNCQLCSEDLETIRNLNLTRLQLRRLSQLFADKDTKHGVSHIESDSNIMALLSMNFQETTAENLKHLCICPYCRKLLYQYRETILNKLPDDKTDRTFPCQKVSASDIFDYVVPYGLNPAKDQYAKFRKYFTSHVTTCRDCLTKMQQLHNTIYEILERPDSGVVTVYHVDDSAKVGVDKEANKLFAGFPIKVEVTECKDKVKAEEMTSTTNFEAAQKQKVSAKKLKLLFKPAIAVAAVILIAIALFLNVPTAKAVTIEQIYKAIEKARNVYIAKFASDQTEPIQKKWVSRPLNIYMTKTEGKWILWDIDNRLRKSKHSDTEVTDTTQLTEENIANITAKMSGSLGLMPFYDISDIPADAKWSHVTYYDLDGTTTSTEVYDLTWVKKTYDGSTTSNKCRVFVDSETNLPQKTELYKKLSDDEYIFISAMKVEYLNDNEMQQIIKEASF